MPDSSPCPCHSKKAYKDCCQPFHEGTKPSTALLLMRSRYAAYARNLTDYIIATTDPTGPQYSKNLKTWKREIKQFSKESDFLGLEIMDFKERGDFATVTFKATVEKNGVDHSFTEMSFFEKREGCWLYKGA